MMQRHSILAGKCYRDRLGAIYRVVGFDGKGVQCVLYHRTDQGGSSNESILSARPTSLRTFKVRSNAPFRTNS
jgi:hypothetical protein